MATKTTNILVKVMVFFAVLGVIFLLTMYNAKLLNTLNWFKTASKTFDWTIIIIASVSYSLGSIAVVIWYNPIREHDENKLNYNARYVGSILLKLLFVLIDGVHVYVYNNTHIDDLATWLSPVYALQTALILFFVGAIVNDFIKNGKQKEEIKKGELMALESKLELKESKIKKLQSNIEVSDAFIKELQTNIEEQQCIIKDREKDVFDAMENVGVLETNIAAYKSKVLDFRSDLKEKQTKIDKYYPYFLKLKVANIRKKSEKNRTLEELEMLHEYEEMSK